MTSYTEVIDYLYRQLPMYQRRGKKAVKKDLTNIRLLCEAFGQPHQKLKFIHLAGTNGKGSVSHIIAAILQSHDLKVGLYTSPHYMDFRERIKINGALITADYVVEWVKKHQQLIEKIQPSFFEITVAMSFTYFAEQEVDLVVLETGLGGRLDSTNIVEPLLSVITHISLDHQEMLGDTVYKIAREKAGIIKSKVPVVIGDYQISCDEVFLTKSLRSSAPITWASLEWHDTDDTGQLTYSKDTESIAIAQPQYPYPFFHENVRTALEAIHVLSTWGHLNWNPDKIINGINQFSQLTYYIGRWQVLANQPLTIADSAHNADALSKVFAHLKTMDHTRPHMVLGFVKEKNINEIFRLLPAEANYYFVKPQIPRALEPHLLKSQARSHHLNYNVFKSVEDGIQKAEAEAGADDVIFISGSSYVVGEALAYFEHKKRE